MKIVKAILFDPQIQPEELGAGADLDRIEKEVFYSSTFKEERIFNASKVNKIIDLSTGPEFEGEWFDYVEKSIIGIRSENE